MSYAADERKKAGDKKSNDKAWSISYTISAMLSVVFGAFTGDRLFDSPQEVVCLAEPKG